MIHIKSYIMGLLCMLPLTLRGQSLELLGLFRVGDSYELKAHIDLQGHSIREASVYSFDMLTGENKAITNYELIEGEFLTATPHLSSPDAAYRMKVVLTDNTVLLSPCFVPASGEQFMWLGDYAWQNATSGWDANHPPRVDQAVDTNKRLKINNTIYHKGISTHANGYFQYEFTRNFSRFVARVGVQDEEINGDVRIGILTNNVSRENFDVYALSNAGRGDKLLYKDVDIEMAGVESFRINVNQLDGNTWGDHAHFVMARLYLPTEETADKQPQQINFQTQGGEIAVGTESISLNATASSGGRVYYRVVKGKELASIRNGNELVFNYGVAGEILVEATQYGDSQYACTNATLGFRINTIPVFSLLTSHTVKANDTFQTFAYLYLDTKQKPLSHLTLQTYNNALQLSTETEIDLMPYLLDTTFSQPQVIQIPYDTLKIARFAARYPGNETAAWITPYYDGLNAFEYVTDRGDFRTGTGYGSVAIDKAYGNSEAINLCNQIYAKGFGIHADGWMETTVEAGKYNRFVADAGKQRSRPGNMEVTIAMNGELLATSGIINSNSKAQWDYQLANDITLVRINLLTGGDGNGSDHGAIGSPRFYLAPTPLRSQSIVWRKENGIHQSKPFTMPLDATASSSLPLFYHIVEGKEYASIENGNQLRIHTVPDKDSIIVEAFQPGNTEWAPATAFRSVFRVTKGRIVGKNERIELENGEQLEELIVYGDASSVGQVTVKSGLVKVKRLILKYTFIPRAWNFMSFPTDLNLAKIADFEQMGYTFNGGVPGKGAFYIRSYNSRKRAENPNLSSWDALSEPLVKGLKGYLVGINDFYGDEPKEVTFTVDNVSLDFESTLRLLNLTLDMTYTEPGSSVPVYISPKNAKGNTLKVEVNFQPENPDVLPINYAKALEDARITFTPNRQGLRLTLPDPTPAKVVIFDQKMKKAIKAIRYTSPMMIDISDLSPGSYRMLISYGNASSQMSFTK